jgi:muramidase (phage lysozyme)
MGRGYRGDVGAAVTLSDLKRLLANTNVGAFLRTIRERESSQDDSAYTVLNGGSHFDVVRRASVQGPAHATRQGGRCLPVHRVHVGGRQAQYGMPDFSPASQDAGAVARLIYRGALEDVLAGRFAAAVARCRHEWTSLPGASESSTSWTMDKALAVYRKWGGRTDDEVSGLRREGRNQPMPGPAPGVPSNQPTEGHMGGLAAAGLIGQLLQTVIGAFAPVARAKVEEAAGKVTDAAGAKALADGLMGVLQQVTGQTDPVQATAAVLAPTDDGRAKLAAVQEQAVARLGDFAGFLDRIAALEAQANEAARGLAGECAGLRDAGIVVAAHEAGELHAMGPRRGGDRGGDPDRGADDRHQAGRTGPVAHGPADGHRDGPRQHLPRSDRVQFGGTSDSNAAAIARDELAARRNQENRQ